MTYTKKQLADSIVKFIANDLMSDEDVCNNKHLKFALCMAKKALYTNPDVIDGFIESPIVANVISEVDGEYNIDVFAKTMKNVLSEYDTYSIVIPPIPMFAPEKSIIKITAEDVDKLLSYLNTETEIVQ